MLASRMAGARCGQVKVVETYVWASQLVELASIVSSSSSIQTWVQYKLSPRVSLRGEHDSKEELEEQSKPKKQTKGYRFSCLERGLVNEIFKLA